MISYEYYKVFYCCGRLMNFTRAAEALNTSQSSVSHTIHTLEHQLGCRLFVRGSRGIFFTPEGERLFYYVSAGCESFMKGEAELMGGFSAESGTVYLSATETALHCCLFEILDQFRRRYPGIKLIIENSSSNEAADAVRTGKSNYAVLTLPADITENFSGKSLMSFSDVLICGSKYAELSEGIFNIKKLNEYPYISLCSGTATRSFFDDYLRRAGVIVHPDIEVATTDLMLPMVESNMGIGFLPEPMLCGSSRNIFIIEPDEKPPLRSVSIVYGKGIAKSPAARTFFEFCTAFAGDRDRREVSDPDSR